ncbi:MAG: DUF6527 family protein [Caulobacteraceae bacterium]
MKISLWQWLPIHPWRVVGTVESADEVPDRLPKNAAVVVSSGGPPKWISFDCPCRSGHRVLLNTDPGRRPAWSVTWSPKGGLSIAPSVDFHDGRRRCHYFVRGGKIDWAKDTVR